MPPHSPDPFLVDIVLHATGYEPPDFLYVRRLPDGRDIAVVPLLGMRARITIGEPVEHGGYSDGW